MVNPYKKPPKSNVKAAMAGAAAAKSKGAKKKPGKPKAGGRPLGTKDTQ